VSCFARRSGPPRSVQASDSPGLLLCQQLVLAANPKAEVQLDPSTYGYQGCSCGVGFKAAATTQEGVVTNLRCVESQVRVRVGVWQGFWVLEGGGAGLRRGPGLEMVGARLTKFGGSGSDMVPAIQAIDSLGRLLWQPFPRLRFS
jgi:hypothetical protein